MRCYWHPNPPSRCLKPHRSSRICSDLTWRQPDSTLSCSWSRWRSKCRRWSALTSPPSLSRTRKGTSCRSCSSSNKASTPKWWLNSWRPCTSSQALHKKWVMLARYASNTSKLPSPTSWLAASHPKPSTCSRSWWSRCMRTLWALISWRSYASWWYRLWRCCCGWRVE